jgi:hypothetical protein
LHAHGDAWSQLLVGRKCVSMAAARCSPRRAQAHVTSASSRPPALVPLPLLGPLALAATRTKRGPVPLSLSSLQAVDILRARRDAARGERPGPQPHAVARGVPSKCSEQWARGVLPRRAMLASRLVARRPPRAAGHTRACTALVGGSAGRCSVARLCRRLATSSTSLRAGRMLCFISPRLLPSASRRPLNSQPMPTIRAARTSHKTQCTHAQTHRPPARVRRQPPERAGAHGRCTVRPPDFRCGKLAVEASLFPAES